MLIKASSPLELAGISRIAIIATTILSALFFLLVIGAGLKAQKRSAVIWIHAMIGKMGHAIEPLNPNGRVQVFGELWNAASLQGEIAAGEPVRIVAVEKLVLFVERNPTHT